MSWHRYTYEQRVSYYKSCHDYQQQGIEVKKRKVKKSAYYAIIDKRLFNVNDMFKIANGLKTIAGSIGFIQRNMFIKYSSTLNNLYQQVEPMMKNIMLDAKKADRYITSDQLVNQYLIVKCKDSENDRFSHILKFYSLYDFKHKMEKYLILM